MTKRRSVGLALGLFSLGAAAAAPVAPTASATSVTPVTSVTSVTVAASTCGAELTTVRSDIDSVQFSARQADRERAGLRKIVDDATALVSVGKSVDAIVKLQNLQTKIDDLAGADRISAGRPPC